MSENHINLVSLPPLELECMKALWSLGSASIHDIRGRIWASRPLAYTTIMTVMGRLARKGAVERRRQGRSHVYRPLLSDAQLRERAVTRLVDDFFLGSRDALQMYLETRGSGNIAADRARSGLINEVATRDAESLAAERHRDSSARAQDHEIDPTLL